MHLARGLTPRQRRIKGPPEGKPWVWLTRELLASPAWRSRSINCARLMDFLLVEYMNHAGTENGNLKATYDQLVESGLTRSQIRAAVEEAEFLGLIRYERGGRWAGSNQPSTYRLTFYADRDISPSTNEWKRRTQEQIDEWKRNRSARKRGARARRKNSSLVRVAALP